MQRIGIIGYGKMGKDIFSRFLCMPEFSHIKVYCRHNSDIYVDKVHKELAKLLRRKRINEEQYNLKLKNIVFTDSLFKLKDCDFIIESISENHDAKNQLFKQLDAIVSPECILTTNTSSIKTDDIFDNISNKARCFGLHFFYPVQFTSFAEINVLSETGNEQIKNTVNLLKKINKKAIVFSGCYHNYINQLITATISFGIQLQQNYNLGIKQFRDIMSELFAVHGLFGLIDGIGLNLLTSSKMTFGCKRLQSLMEYGNSIMKQWLDNGISGESNCFFKSLLDETESFVSEHEKEEILFNMTCFIHDEVKTACNEYGGESHILAEAVQDIMGLPESFFNLNYF